MSAALPPVTLERSAVSAAGPSRKQARRDALFLLYQREVTGRPLAELVDGHRLREGYPPDEFTIAVVSGVMERQDELDATLAAHSTNWPLERLAPLERSVLRLALFEIEAGLTPPEVAIDEAVRLDAALRDRRGRRARQRHPRGDRPRGPEAPARRAGDAPAGDDGDDEGEDDG